MIDISSGNVGLKGQGDIVIIPSGRNVDENPFQDWIAEI